jgi:serine protease Do
MKKIFLSGMITCSVLFIAGAAFSQTKNQSQKREEIIIRKNGDESKTVVVIDSNEITINGQPLSEYNGDVQVLNGSGLISDGEDLLAMPRANVRTFDVNSNKAFLGVLSEKSDKGALIKNVTKQSAAEKAGLKEQDIITKVGDKKISTPEELAYAIKSYKPNDQVKISYLRDGKKKDTKVNLGAQQATAFNFNGSRNIFRGGSNFNFKRPDFSSLELTKTLNFLGRNQPKLGLKIQDTEDDNGVKILNVGEGSAAEKSGFKKDDIITEWNGQKVNSVDEIMEQLNSPDSKGHFSVKGKRNNIDVNFDVRVPKHLNSADL